MKNINRNTHQLSTIFFTCGELVERMADDVETVS